jgi:lysophospholipase L1-like esterase
VGRFPALPHPLRGVLGLRARLLEAALHRLARGTDGAVHVPLPALAGNHFFCEDRFHPSEEGYAVWGRAMGRAAAAALPRDLPPTPGV